MPAVGAVLLLHGQPGSGHDWHGVVEALDPDLTPLAVDRPGWDGVRRATDLAGNVAAALATLDGRGAERVAVAGHSLGAAVAARLALDHPARVAALILISPAVNAAAIEWPDLVLAAPLAGPMTSAALMAGAGLALSSPPLRHAIGGRLGIDEGYLRLSAPSLLRPWAWRSFLFEQRMLIRELPALERRLSQIAAPTTVISGSEDRVVPVRAAKQLADTIPGARLEVLSGAGHLLPQRNPGQVAGLIWQLVEEIA